MYAPETLASFDFLALGVVGFAHLPRGRLNCLLLRQHRTTWHKGEVSSETRGNRKRATQASVMLLRGGWCKRKPFRQAPHG